MTEVVSVLPYNATRQERAQEGATARLAAVPVPIRSLWNPDTCPAVQLPWLAWALSVDVWSADWTETQKRGAIKRSFAVHQRKGTAGAVIQALQALGFGTQVIEWFQKTPAGDPYTFEVNAEFIDTGLSLEGLDEVERIALATKNVRSHLAVVRGIMRSDGDRFVGVGMVSGEDTEVQPNQLTEIEAAAAYFMGVAAVSFETTNILPEAA